jgi:hypothetical protein
MLENYYFNMTIFFADARGLQEIRRLTESALNCQLQVYEAEGQRDEERFEGYVFGFWIHLEYAGFWQSRHFYRLSGAASTTVGSTKPTPITMDHHVIELLRRRGIEHFYRPAEYQSEVAQHMPDQSPASHNS